MDPVVVGILRLALALLFGAAALHKLRDLRAFTATLLDYRIGPRALVGGLGPLLAVAESAIAIGLCVPRGAAVASIGAAALLALYSAAIGANLARGRVHIDCGCFGPSVRPGVPTLGRGLLVRNAALIAAATLAAQAASLRALTWVDGLSLLAGVLVAILCFQAANELLAHAPVSQRLRRSP